MSINRLIEANARAIHYAATVREQQCRVNKNEDSDSPTC